MGRIITSAQLPPSILDISSPSQLTDVIVRWPHALGHALGRDLLLPIHGQWIKYMWDSDVPRALQAHRGARKSTAMAIGIIRHMLFHPDDRIAVVRKTFADAAEVVQTVQALMETPECQLIFETIHGFKPRALRKAYGRLLYNFKRTKTPEGTLTAHGLDGSLVGKHYDRMLCDDLITIKDRLSRAERERTKTMIIEIASNIIDPDKVTMWMGTPWHMDDGWTDIPVAYDDILLFPVDVCGVLTPEQIKLKKQRIPAYDYSLNYLLEIPVGIDQMFGDPVRGMWDWLAPAPYGHLDTAFGGGHTNALTFMAGLGPSGKKQALGWVSEKSILDWAPEVAKKCDEYRVKELYVENNADKGYTERDLKSMFKEMGCKTRVEGYVESANKHIKISSYLYKEYENIEWAAETDDDYLVQIMGYEQGKEPDDAPDSAATLIRQKFHRPSLSDDSLWG